VVERSTIYQVAQRSGVSTATVSRVMHDSKGFSAETRERVLASAAELGWVPSGPARGLAFRRAGIVGLLFPDLGGSGDMEDESPLYVDQVIRGAERAATAAGDAVLIAATHSSSGRTLAYSVAGKVDGLVVMARSLSDQDVASISRSVPTVVVGNSSVEPSLDYVGADNHGGQRAVTTHLVETHGYSDLAFVAGPPRAPDSMERFNGFCDALQTAGLPVPKAPAAAGGFTEAGGARAMHRLLDDGRQPRAVVFGNDEMAIGALSVLRSARLSVPSDVAVTGFDDISSSRHVRPALTTVRQPIRDLGEQAVRMLFDQLRDPEAPRRRLVLPTDVVLRRSCGCRTPTASRRERTAA
jgi:LacI family transcriptional regulator